ncbi:DUF3618 domain-containing protein [Stackebrandtia nassauensis]|uniref:Uncharacterized protein n=1 Tax=Stackebrandtia nassauensis (strain DSM 44728 / CIP 108903 / NRRL B-16338 / NBRC 102104 / LLR-40K-21) TaxID=446470 RepID=D3Q168_STANL|nr:DUF3618 domain-containing protein [Stackebrandtia nassauensis]ADD45648.1 hypothetical protein Snas_6023 [Stackebrandtia nassauensis DSM 44728]
MVETPDRIRSDIESTRAELTHDVNRLADRVSPRRIARRRWHVLRDKLSLLYQELTGRIRTKPRKRVRGRQGDGSVVASRPDRGGEERTLPHRP